MPKRSPSQAGKTSPDQNGAANVQLAQFHRDLFFEAFSNQAQYGRWILASLLAVHAGALLAITQSGDAAGALFVASGRYLLCGLSIALFCGGLAWINFTASMRFYSAAFGSYIQGRDDIKPSKAVRVVIAVTIYGTPLAAVCSLAMFMLAAEAAIATISIRLAGS
jgi:hypothetical protein